MNNQISAQGNVNRQKPVPPPLRKVATENLCRLQKNRVNQVLKQMGQVGKQVDPSTTFLNPRGIFASPLLTRVCMYRTGARHPLGVFQCCFRILIFGARLQYGLLRGNILSGGRVRLHNPSLERLRLLACRCGWYGSQLHSCRGLLMDLNVSLKGGYQQSSKQPSLALKHPTHVPRLRLVQCRRGSCRRLLRLSRHHGRAKHPVLSKG